MNLNQFEPGKTSTMNFLDFKIGDLLVIKRSFSDKDFEVFSSLSADANKLHHDENYASQTKFGRTIVPLHLTLAPLSAIAGMHFPGLPSLYLGHDVRSIAPVYYGEDVSYSAKIVAINEVKRVLTVRVLVISRSTICADISMRVQALDSQWPAPAPVMYTQPESGKWALITGATGDIGSAFAAGLFTKGWKLILQDRGNEAKREIVRARLAAVGHSTDYKFFGADLNNSAELTSLCGTLKTQDNLALVVHCASPEPDAALHSLVQVNYSACKQITDAVLPSMLLRQQGNVVFMSSIATERAIAGWENYAASKAMAGNYLSSINKRFGEFGVKCCSILAGFVVTSFSEKFRKESSALLPEELANGVLELVHSQSLPDSLIMEYGRTDMGRTAFQVESHSPQPVPGDSAHAKSQLVPMEQKGSEPGARSRKSIESVVRKVLKVPDWFDLAGSGVGLTAGWDSLRHIELALELERALGIKFSAREIEDSMTFEKLCKICGSKSLQ